MEEAELRDLVAEFVDLTAQGASIEAFIAEIFRRGISRTVLHAMIESLAGAHTEPCSARGRTEARLQFVWSNQLWR